MDLAWLDAPHWFLHFFLICKFLFAVVPGLCWLLPGLFFLPYVSHFWTILGHTVLMWVFASGQKQVPDFPGVAKPNTHKNVSQHLSAVPQASEQRL